MSNPTSLTSADMRAITSSPFDSIKQNCPDGGEFWSARKLMPLMGYRTWERFKNPLDRAMVSAANQIGDVASDFRRSAKVFGQRGPAQEDFELSRFAAYLVAMNGDPNKPEVAAAQSYFAIRTREAETAPAVRTMSTFDILRAQIDQLEAAQRIAEEAKAIAERTEARLDSIEGRHDWYTALGYARLHRIRETSKAFLRKVGVKATAIAKPRGIKPAKVYSEIHGEVNSYPAWVWEAAFEAAGIAAEVSV